MHADIIIIEISKFSEREKKIIYPKLRTIKEIFSCNLQNKTKTRSKSFNEVYDGFY